MPTREAYAAAVLTLLTFFVAFNLQAGWVYAVDALLAGLLIVGWLSARHAVWRISVTRALPVEAVEGEPVGVGLEITARGPGRRYFLEIADNVPGLEPARVGVPVLNHRGWARASYRSVAVRRGVHQVQTAVVRSGGLTRLFEARRIIPVPGEITVYPRYWKLARFAPATWTPAAQTAGTSRRRGGLEFYGLRDYRLGDSMRHVHWRSSARRGALMVREFEQEVPGTVTLLVDARLEVQGSSGTENTFEDLIRAAASITWYVTSRGGAVRLLTSTGSHQLDVKGGWHQVMRVLAALRPDGELNPARILSGAALAGEPSLVLLTPDAGALVSLARFGGRAAGILADPASYRDPASFVAPLRAAAGEGPRWVIRRGDDIGALLEQPLG